LKYLDDILHLEFQELVDAGVPIDTIKQAKARESAGWSFKDDPSDRRRVLIAYEPLRDKYKDMVTAKYGDPYTYCSAQIIKPLLKSDPKDIETLDNYRSTGERLTDEHYQTYRTSCQYLAMLSMLTPQRIRAMGFRSVKDHFYPTVISLIKAEDIKLPTNIRALQRKVKQYQQDGALAVIDGRHGNDNARKINRAGQALIVELMSKHNGFTPEQITQLYNNIAEAKGWPGISSRSILHYKYEIGITSLRNGFKQWRDKFDPVVTRSRPSLPNDLWVGDGTPFELYYQKPLYDNKGRKKTMHWFRKTVYVVIDAFNDMVVGYAIGDQENAELARRAWKNAVINTGCMPRQIKVDNYAIKELRPFYEGLCLKFSPSAVGNARDKVVESFFARLYDQVVRIFPNAAGRNITAKEQPNRDYLMKIRHEFPNEEQLIRQVDGALEFWNQKPRKKLNNKSLFTQWTEADHSQDRTLTHESRLLAFGVKHRWTNKLTNKGIEVTLNGSPQLYCENSVEFYKTIGTDYQVWYDPDDLSRIMVKANDGKIRFILEKDAAIPMSYHDQDDGDRKRLNDKLRVKKQLAREVIIDDQRDRLNLLEQEDIIGALDPVAIARGLLTINGDQKTLRNHAHNQLKTGGMHPADDDSKKDSYNDIYDRDFIPARLDNKRDDDSYGDAYDRPLDWLDDDED
jgi:hypothetical protein